MPQKLQLAMSASCQVVAQAQRLMLIFNHSPFLQEDFDKWRMWMGDVQDPDTSSTWFSWNKVTTTMQLFSALAEDSICKRLEHASLRARFCGRP